MNQLPSPNAVLITHLKKRVGGKFRQMRHERNYSIRAVAQDIGHSQSTLCEIENGKHFNLEIIAELADYFGISLDEVFPRPALGSPTR